MTHADLAQAKNPKLRGSLAAMRRAADMARKTAIQTGTGIVVVQGANGSTSPLNNCGRGSPDSRRPRSAVRSSRRNDEPDAKKVTAKCYGGDISRKKKLLEKQS